MHTYPELERIAAEGGYTVGSRDISRIAAAHVHQVHAGLMNSGSDEAGAAILAITRLRHWLLHGGGDPPPVRGAGFVRSDREVWVAYTTYEFPAIVRGRASLLNDLRAYLPVSASPGYDGSLRVRTNPPVHLVAAAGAAGVVLQSPLGSMVLSRQDAVVVEKWLSVTVRRKDRRAALCLPGEWQRG